MGKGPRCVFLAALLVVAAAPAAARADGGGPPWPQALPPAPGAAQPEPQGVPGCEHPSVSCVDQEIRHMTALRDQFGCDHRAVFATTYLHVTEETAKTIRQGPERFDDTNYLILEDVLFADYYFRAVDDYIHGRPVPPAWKIAFDAAVDGDTNGAQDLLLGINAHVQNDQAQVIAALGIRRPDGSSGKPDHDRFNAVLERSYGPIVDDIAEHYDPFVSFSNAQWNPADDIVGLEVVKEWREMVWRNAERLTNAGSDEERQQVVSSIEANAAAWAQAIATPQQPGYRAQRDAYCAAHPRKPAGAPAAAAAPGKPRTVQKRRAARKRKRYCARHAPSPADRRARHRHRPGGGGRRSCRRSHRVKRHAPKHR
jgi:Family of unknown function (DUF5995)